MASESVIFSCAYAFFSRFSARFFAISASCFFVSLGFFVATLEASTPGVDEKCREDSSKLMDPLLLSGVTTQVWLANKRVHRPQRSLNDIEKDYNVEIGRAHV